jgi:hypothetical protein
MHKYNTKAFRRGGERLVRHRRFKKMHIVETGYNQLVSSFRHGNLFVGEYSDALRFQWRDHVDAVMIAEYVKRAIALFEGTNHVD